MQGERTDLPNTRRERFWKNVEIKGEEECWNWKHITHVGNRYPTCAGGEVHRMVYKYTKGPIPKYNKDGRKIVVRHLCGNKICCNPNHLVLGTQSENNIDRYKIDGAKKLTNEQVLHVKNLRAQGQTYAKIAKLYNTSNVLIRNVCIGKGTYGGIV